MNFRQRPPTRPTGRNKEKRKIEHNTVIGVSLALIVILTIMLILLGKKPVATKKQRVARLHIGRSRLEDDPLDSKLSYVETRQALKTTELRRASVKPEQVTVAPAATNRLGCGTDSNFC